MTMTISPYASHEADIVCRLLLNRSNTRIRIKRPSSGGGYRCDWDDVNGWVTFVETATRFVKRIRHVHIDTDGYKSGVIVGEAPRQNTPVLWTHTKQSLVLVLWATATEVDWGVNKKLAMAFRERFLLLAACLLLLSIYDTHGWIFSSSSSSSGSSG